VQRGGGGGKPVDQNKFGPCVTPDVLPKKEGRARLNDTIKREGETFHLGISKKNKGRKGTSEGCVL